MEVVGGVASVLQLVGSVTRLAKNINEVREKYNNVALNMTLVSSQLSSIRAALEAIAEWRQEAKDHSRPSLQLDEDLAISLNCCAILITVIDAKLGEAGYTPGLKQKIRHLWLEDTLKEYLSNLEGQVRALQLLLTIFQCRTQTEQRQRLEQAESRTIIKQMRSETATLSDTLSVRSFQPSITFDMDEELMRHPAYQQAYGRNQIRRRPVPNLSRGDSVTKETSHAHPGEKVLEEGYGTEIEVKEEPREDDNETSARSVAESGQLKDEGQLQGNLDKPPKYTEEELQAPRSTSMGKAPAVPVSDLGEPFGGSLATGPAKAPNNIGLVMTAYGLSQADQNSNAAPPHNQKVNPDTGDSVAGSLHHVLASSLTRNDRTNANGAQDHPSTSPHPEDVTCTTADQKTPKLNDTVSDDADVPNSYVGESWTAPRPAKVVNEVDLYDASIRVPSIKEPEKDSETHHSADPFDDVSSSSWPSSSEQSTKSMTEQDESLNDTKDDDKFGASFTASLSGPFQWHLDDLNAADPKLPSSKVAEGNSGHPIPPPPSRAAPLSPQLALNGSIPESQDSSTPSIADQSLPIPSIGDDPSIYGHRRSSSIGNSSRGSFDRSSMHINTSPSSQTLASSIDPISPTSPRERAQMKLQSLQRELAEAKSRGDSKGAQRSLEKSIEIIHQTYLSDKPPATWPPIPKPSNRGSLLRLPSLAQLTNRPKKPQILALFNAVRRGDDPTIKDYLDQGVSANTRSEEFDTPLMQAAVHGQLKSMELLKQYGVDEFSVNGKGQTALHVAIAANRIDSVKWLLQAYPSDASSAARQKPFRLSRSPSSIGSRSKTIREASDKEGFKPMHLAASKDMIDIMNVLVANGADVEAKNNWGGTPLHTAAYSNSLVTTKRLLSLRAKTQAVDLNGMTPLHWAAQLNRVDAVEMLIEANSNFRYAGNGDYPIHTAVRNGHVNVIEIFLGRGADIEVKTCTGDTMLHVATISKQLKVIEFLFRNSASANPFSRYLPARVSPDGTIIVKEFLDKTQPPCTTPLHFACFAGWYEGAATLLDHNAFVNVNSNDGRSPLIYATESDDTNLVYLLIARGAKVNATVPKTRMTAAHIASHKGNLETLQKLYQSGANLFARSHDMQTPEEYAYKCPDKAKRKAMLEWYAKARTLRLMRAREPPRSVGTPTLNVQNYTSTSPHNSDHTTATQHNVPRLVRDEMALIRQLSPSVQDQYFDPQYDAFPDAPPPYVAGPSAPLRLANRPGVYRPPSGS